MGNCQAAIEDVAKVMIVIQYPNGKVDTLFSPPNNLTARHLMNSNPGYYVALLISSSSSSSSFNTTIITNHHQNLTNLRIKILKPTDTLALGHVYRLITAQEVMKGLWAKRQAKINKALSLSSPSHNPTTTSHHNKDSIYPSQVKKWEGRRMKSNIKGRTSWEPSLHSISEAST